MLLTVVGCIALLAVAVASVGIDTADVIVWVCVRKRVGVRVGAAGK
jgi:hypothetical protein